MRRLNGSLPTEWREPQNIPELLQQIRRFFLERNWPRCKGLRRLTVVTLSVFQLTICMTVFMTIA